jgi:hypothetical protein
MRHQRQRVGNSKEVDYTTMDDKVLRPWIHQSDHDVKDKLLELERSAVLAKPFASYLGNSTIDKKPPEFVELQTLLSQPNWLHEDYESHELQVTDGGDEQKLSSNQEDESTDPSDKAPMKTHEKSLANDADLLRYIAYKYNKSESLPTAVPKAPMIKVTVSKKIKKSQPKLPERLLKQTESSSHHVLPKKPLATSTVSSSSTTANLLEFLKSEQSHRSSLMKVSTTLPAVPPSPIDKATFSNQSSSNIPRPKSASTTKPASADMANTSHSEKQRTKSETSYSNITLKSFDRNMTESYNFVQPKVVTSRPHTPKSVSSTPRRSTSSSDTRFAESSISPALSKMGVFGSSPSSTSVNPIAFLSHRRKSMKSLRDHFLTTNGVYSIPMHPENSNDIVKKTEEQLNFSRHVSRQVRDKNRVDHVWNVLTTPGFVEAIGPENVFRSDQQINYTEKYEQVCRTLYNDLYEYLFIC